MPAWRSASTVPPRRADDVSSPSPAVRRLLLTFDESIQRKNPEILDDEEERSPHSSGFARTSEQELSNLIGDFKSPHPP